MGYRLYFLDGADHIRGVLPFECAGDPQARIVATKHSQGKAVELWNLGRLVMRRSPTRTRRDKAD